MVLGGCRNQPKKKCTVKMKYLFGQFLAVVWFFVLTAGCASTGIIITKNNKKLEKPLYSISIPADQGWYMYRDDNDPDAALFMKNVDSAICSMRFTTNWIVDENMKTWTAKQIADEYRNFEKQNMINMGVMTGLYELKDVVFDTEMIEGKKYYIMNYVTLKKGEGTIQKSALYLYFPQDKNISEFVIALYFERYPVNNTLTKSAKTEFIEILRSLMIRE